MAKKDKVGAEIDAIAQLMVKRDGLQAQANALDAQVKARQEALLKVVQKQKLHGALGSLGKAVVDDEDVPTVEDWDKLYAHIAKKKEWDLLQRRVGSQAVKERWANGVKVPGVTKFRRVALRVVLNKRRRK